MPIVEPFRMSPSYPHQPGHRLRGNLHEPGRRPHTTPFTQMANDIVGFGLRELRIQQGGAASLGALLTARPAAQEPDVVLTVDFAHTEMVLARETKPLACRVDTR